MKYIVLDSGHVVLDNGKETISFKIEKVLKEKTTDRYSYKILENKDIAFDHSIVILFVEIYK